MIDIKKNFSLKGSNSLAFDHRVEYYCEAKTIEDCQEFIGFCLKRNIPIFPLGEGTNIVLTKKIKGAVLKVSVLGKKKKEEDVIIGGGENWNDVVLWSLKKKLYGLENLALIPGTAGAAPVQNIGAYGEEISSRLISVEVINLNNNELIYLNSNECKFGYRDSIFKREEEYLITSIKLKLNKSSKTNTSYHSLHDYLLRDDIDPSQATPHQVCRAVTSIRKKILPDPSIEPNVGSFYKNLFLNKSELQNLKNYVSDLPYFKTENDNLFKVPLAFLIEKAGLKGKRIGKCHVSDKHALVLVADEGSSSKELIKLSDFITRHILKTMKIDIEIEPKII